MKQFPENACARCANRVATAPLKTPVRGVCIPAVLKNPDEMRLTMTGLSSQSAPLTHVSTSSNPPKKNTMNKAELVAEVQKLLGAETTKAAAERAVEATLAGVTAGIKKDKLVQVIGFGTFTVTTRAARSGVNPATGAKIKIKASKGVKFKAGAGLKEVAAKTK
ncbi:MAG: HU family DNA-binding protein [Puniceicoccales bacterium]|jgi:nucleoid DNA-binding protein|nr:HU family DNA-binding protein [Puniceicoccales bacterium]